MINFLEKKFGFEKCIFVCFYEKIINFKKLINFIELLWIKIYWKLKITENDIFIMAI